MRKLWMVPLVAMLLSACGTGSDPDGKGDVNGGSPSSAPTSETPAPVTAAVYFAVDTRNGFRLAREQHDLPAADPAVAAVEVMIAGADDPDYGTTWNPETTVLSVTEAGGTITVDLSADAREANAGTQAAELMVQQLVHTVTDALDAEDAQVELRVEGETAGDLWGAVVWDEPVARAEALAVRQLVQIDSPREGEESSSPVTVKGEAAVFEANLPWRVLDEAGAVVDSGTTMTAEGQAMSPFRFEVDLEPGTYVIEITEDDPSDGEGGPPMVDTRTVRVR